MMSTAFSASRFRVPDHRREFIDPAFVVCGPNAPPISRLGAPYSILPISSPPSSPFDGRLAHKAPSTHSDLQRDPTRPASGAPRAQMYLRWLPAPGLTGRQKQKRNELQREPAEQQQAAAERAEQQRRKEEELAETRRRKEDKSRQNKEEISHRRLLKQREVRQREEEELRVKEEELRTAEEELLEAVKELRVREEELQAKKEESQAREEESQAKRRKLQAREDELQAEDEEIRAKLEELQAKEEEFQAKEDKILVKGEEFERRRHDLWRREEELTRREEGRKIEREEEQKNEEGELLEEMQRHDGYERKQAEGEGIRGWEAEEKGTREKKRRKMDLQGEERQEEDYDYAEELSQQQEFSGHNEQMDEAKSRETSWFFSNPVPSSSPPASDASSVHSQWSSNTRRSSASSASSPVSDSTRTPWGACFVSISLGDDRTPTVGTYKTSTDVWTTTDSNGVGVGNFSGRSGSCVHNYPPSEAKWHQIQEEHVRKQQEQFKRDSMRAAWAAADTSLTLSGQERMRRAWSSYESAWATLKDRPMLNFRTMPWPVLDSPKSKKELTIITIGAFVLSPSHSPDKGARDRLKEQLRRWHPDRFESKWLLKACVEETVRQGASHVVCILNELLAMETNVFG